MAGVGGARLSYNVPGEEINSSYPLWSYCPLPPLMVNYKYAIKPCRRSHRRRRLHGDIPRAHARAIPAHA